MFQRYVPSKTLQPYIAFYYTIKCRKSDYDYIISEYSLPNGFGYMGFHSCGSFYIFQNNKIKELPRFYTVGQQTQHYYINSDSDLVDFYGVGLQPTGLWHLFGLDMPTITDSVIATTCLFRNDFQKFTKQFDSLKEVAPKIKLIENLLLHELLTAQPQLNVIDSAIQKINETYGCCSLTEITSGLGISPRYFQKKFKKMVGITPTAFKRIIRFNFMFAEIQPDSHIDYQSLSALCNYYDFPHFSKDFKKYCGACPSKFHIDKFHFLQEVITSKVLLGK
ncbi:helix-turn-helix domain-containing protein [Aequorivita capsosiphonis]|uniref:helix-turn-helix domain-containing protein n=1 Tax=Aequorivita capsosiphonis TaxID=487317 RepID=UPI0003FCA2B4|nr:helix-turn-helix domain-containing protein [Aequorivita capsosiphonis]